MKRLPGKVVKSGPSPMVDFLSEKSLVKEKYNNLPHGEKSRYLAYASSVWGIKEIASLLDLTYTRVEMARQQYKHMIQEMNFVAVETAAKVYLTKALEIASKIDVSKMNDDRKPQAVKALMDACDIARLQGIKTNDEDAADETVELFYRVRRRLKQAKDDIGGEDVEDDKQEAIDITGEVETIGEKT